MNFTIFPKVLSKATNERITDELKQKYWNYIKLFFKFKLKFKPVVTDYNHVVCIDYKEYGFWFRITENYKIEVIHNKCDKEFMENVSEILKPKSKPFTAQVYPAYRSDRYDLCVS